MVPVLKWIHETGETGEVIFSNLVPSGNTINDEPEMVFEGTLKTGTGELIEFEISSGGVLYYPIEVRPPLTTNKIYRVKYRNQYPHFWIVDQGTENEVQKRKECEELKLELQKVQSQLLLKPKDQELLSKVTLLEQKIAQICL